LLALLGKPSANGQDADLYAVAYRNRKSHDKWRLDFLVKALSIGAQLPAIPLWLASNLNIPLDLEKTYEETCQVLRIGAE
jgi:hypothetical protein